MLSDGEVLNLHSVTKDSYDVKGLVELREFIRTRVREVFPHESAACCLAEASHARLLKMVNVDFPLEHLSHFVPSKGRMHGPLSAWLRHQTPLFVRVDQDNATNDPACVLSPHKHVVRSVASHGVFDVGGSFFSYFCFGEVHPSVQERYKDYLNFLIPYLHVVLVRELSRARVRVDEALTSNDADAPAIRPAVNDAGVGHALTQRERQILNWVSIGKTNWEISRIIDVSENTVKNHVQSIYKKLGVKNRTQAAGKAVSFIAEVAVSSSHLERSDGSKSSHAPKVEARQVGSRYFPSEVGLGYGLPMSTQGHGSGKHVPLLAHVHRNR